MTNAMEREEIWRRIEAEAREQASAELEALLQEPLVFGRHIAWAEQRFGRTDGLSPVHRVGYPIGDDPFTTCGEKIPHPICWLPLNARLIERMPNCRFCASEYQRLTKERAA